MGSLTYKRAKCKVLKGEIVDDVARFGGNPALLKLLEALDVQLDRMDGTAQRDESAGGAAATDRGDLHIDEA